MTIKKYEYTNLLERKKTLTMRPTDENDIYFVDIWDVATGELCASGKKHFDEIAEFLAHYGVKI